MINWRCKHAIKLAATCVLTSAVTMLAADPFLDSPATGRFILAPPTGRDLLHQCSRGTPQRISKLWAPSLQDIDELELALPTYLESREKAAQGVPPKGQAYHRQYVGFTRGSERFIYGNFYPARAATGYWKDKESKQAFGVCDGGTVFWGVVFRVSTKTFEEIQFNGFA